MQLVVEKNEQALARSRVAGRRSVHGCKQLCFRHIAAHTALNTMAGPRWIMATVAPDRILPEGRSRISSLSISDDDQ
jgi:hypothetical protein